MEPSKPNKRNINNIKDGLSWIKKPKNMFGLNTSTPLDKHETTYVTTISTKTYTKVESQKTELKEAEEQPVTKTKKKEIIILEENPSAKTEAIVEALENKNNAEERALEELCKRLVSTIKSGSHADVSLFKKIASVLGDNFKGDHCKDKLDLLNTLTDHLRDANKEELRRIKNEFSRIFLPTSLIRFVIDPVDISLTRSNQIGSGEYSNVYVSILTVNGRSRKVAVKVGIKGSTKIRHEAAILSRLSHSNVIQLIGINRGATMMMLEYMDYENILKAIVRGQITSSPSGLLLIIRKVISGMEYVHSQKIIHRDLALRNIFFNERADCKIGDFELAVYVGNTSGLYVDTVQDIGPVPRENLSPESVSLGIYTYKSDVWSMGVLCWELFNVASDMIPIPFLHKSLVMERVRQGFNEILSAAGCPNVLFSYIKEELLQINPSRRPTFTEIKRTIRNMRF